MYKQINSVLICLCLFANFSKGQFLYYEKTFDENLYGESSNNAIYSNNVQLYFVYGGTYTNTSNHSYFKIVTLDELGAATQIAIATIDSGNFEIGNLIEANNGFVSYAFRKKQQFGPNTKLKYALKKFNNTGEVAFSREYGADSLDCLFNHCIKTISNGFVLIGQSANSTDGNIYLVLSDSIGNIISQKYYGGSLYESAHSIIQTPDLGFLILGWTRSYGAGLRDWYLVKTDSVGNQEWQKTYGNSLSQSGWGIIALSDGNYLMSGGAGNVNARMIKINPLGIAIWQKDYAYPGSESGSNYLFWPKELSDGSIVAVGLTDNATEGNAGYLQKTDSAGNLIWQQKYNFNNETDLFYNVLPTTDGGFLLSGQCVNPATNSQDAWLLKVDSLGCPVANCMVGVEEEEIMDKGIDVFPNPFNNSFTVSYSLPEKAVAVEIEVYNLMGQSVLKYSEANTQSGIKEINIGPCNGIYFVTIRLNGKLIHQSKQVCLGN